MKILFLTEFFPKNGQLIFTGGVEARVYYLVKQAKKDFRVQVIASSSRQVPATAFSVLTRIGYMIMAFIKVMTAKFDFIEASNVVTYLPAFFAAKFKKKPVIIWIPDVLGKNWFDFGWFVGCAGWLIEKIYLKLPWDGVIALSDSTKAKLLKEKIRTKNLTVVHGGIDPAEFILAVQPEKFAKTTICCVARLVKTKRLNILIKALALLNRFPDLHLLIVGRGPEKNRLVKLINQSRLSAKVKIVDYLPRQELIETMYRSRLFCLPSVVEGFGLVTIEAMACGLPVILVGIPVNQEITQFGQGTVFFKPNSESDLAIQIEKLLIDKKLYRRKQLEALKLSQNYTWNKAYQETKKFYENCLNR